MKQPNDPYLTPDLYEALQSERLSFLSTVDSASGMPFMNAVSWVYALNDQTLRIAVDSRSKIVQNIQQHPLVSLAVFASASTYTICAKAALIEQDPPDVPLNVSILELTITDVRDVMFYGSKIAVEPSYEKTYDEEAAAKLDARIMKALQNARGGSV